MMQEGCRARAPRASAKLVICRRRRGEGEGEGGRQQTPGNAAIRYCATQRPEMNNVLRDKVPRKCSFDY